MNAVEKKKLERQRNESREEYERRMKDMTEGNTDVADGLSLEKGSAAYEEYVEERKAEKTKQQKHAERMNTVRNAAGVARSVNAARKGVAIGKKVAERAAKAAIFADGSIGLGGNVIEQVSDMMTTETADERMARLSKGFDLTLPEKKPEPEEEYLPGSKTINKYC